MLSQILYDKTEDVGKQYGIIGLAASKHLVALDLPQYEVL